MTGYRKGARYWVGPSRKVVLDSGDECFDVFIDGRIQRCITVHAASDNPVSPAQARELAAVLIEAANDIDRWAGAICT